MATTNTPAVSVIVPCFNQGEFLDETVASVLAQTYQDFEILVVDDGSTDPHTCALLSGYERPKTRVFHTPNQGLAAARNYLIARALGTYLCPLDSDDRLLPTFLERTTSILDNDPTLAIVSPRLETFGQASYLWPPDEKCGLPTLLCEQTLITPALVRRKAVLEVGGYDEQMPAQGDEDWDLCISLAEAGHRGVVLPDVLFEYRQRPGTMGELCTTGQTHLDLMRYLVKKHRASYDAHLIDVLLWKDDRSFELDHENKDRQRQVSTTTCAVERRRAERDLLRRGREALVGLEARGPSS